MNDRNIIDIRNHLEFLGYKVEDPTTDKDGDISFIAKSTQKPNLWVFFGKKDNFFVAFQSLWSGLKNINTIEQWEVMNKVNKNNFLASAYLDLKEDDASLIFKASYIGAYDKNTFGSFIEAFTAYIENVIRADDFKKSLVK